GKLMSGLEAQLGGMGTAFSSSLLGLAGSLVVGLLDLFAGHGQNRFYRELEEWLSTITRLGFASGEGDGTQQAATSALLDHMVSQVEAMQALTTEAQASRTLSDDNIGALGAAIGKLSDRLATQAEQSALLSRIADSQEALVTALSGAEGGAHSDAESRMRLRSIDVQLLRILEEISAGRQESVSDLRNDIAALTGAIRQLSRGAVGRG
ncbi:MAG: biopolymer transporter ExbB, partial [Paracoccaceae bacterium]